MHEERTKRTEYEDNKKRVERLVSVLRRKKKELAVPANSRVH
jgi:hypothetical protein